MILPERVFGSPSAKRMSSGFAMWPSCSPTQSRSSFASFSASALSGRAPRVTTWGWSTEAVSAQRTPALLIAPETDGQVSPERVVELYEDLGSEKKILVHLACSSHNAMWETNREKLFAASLEWLRSGTVQGTATGEIRLTKD